MFRKKNVPFHPAAGASGQLSRQTPGFGTDRVTRMIDISDGYCYNHLNLTKFGLLITDTTYAVVHQTGRFTR